MTLDQKVEGSNPSSPATLARPSHPDERAIRALLVVSQPHEWTIRARMLVSWTEKAPTPAGRVGVTVRRRRHQDPFWLSQPICMPITEVTYAGHPLY